MCNEKKMLNFTVGPVQSETEVLNIGAEQVPYFRTPEFSALMLENEEYMKKFTNAGEDSRAVFLTGSGTLAMETAVISFFDSRDKVLAVNGGGFGSRFSQLCRLHDVPCTEIKLESGKTLTEKDLNEYNGRGYTGFLVNIHETSTGVYYDLKMIAEFCKKNNLFLVVDAISSFLADPFDMQVGVDVMFTGSQKALACPPGISVMVLGKRAVERLEEYPAKCMYMDLKDALKNGERGQTPFTPAVGILRQIHRRLANIYKAGGAKSEIEKVAALANDFRSKIKGLPFEIYPDSMSNAITTLHPITCSAQKIFVILKDEYNIWICPNGGDLADEIFRVGHIGALTFADNDTLIAAFRDLQARGII